MLNPWLRARYIVGRRIVLFGLSLFAGKRR
jgi:hypothetical protein